MQFDFKTDQSKALITAENLYEYLPAFELAIIDSRNISSDGLSHWRFEDLNINRFGKLVSSNKKSEGHDR